MLDDDTTISGAELDEVFSRPAKYWQVQKNGRVKCQLCPRECSLGEGQRGFCFVRLAANGQLWLDAYGRNSGFALDPIEKKPLHHFLPGSKVVSFGTAGCNLSCKFCQNWNISKAKDNARLSVSASPQEIAATAHYHLAESVAFTYNDPVIFAEYAMDTAIACHELGIKTVAVTAGYINSLPRRDFFSVMDAANIDLKGFSEDFYWKLTGAHLRNILDTIVYVAAETRCWLELTNLVIPGENDSATEITQLCAWIRNNIGLNVPIHFSAFHPDWKMRNVPPTPASTLELARKIARQEGLNYVYTGNIRDLAGSSTYCAHCGELLVMRDCFEIVENRIENGICPHCGLVIPGVWC